MKNTRLQNQNYTQWKCPEMRCNANQTLCNSL